MNFFDPDGLQGLDYSAPDSEVEGCFESCLSNLRSAVPALKKLSLASNAVNTGQAFDEGCDTGKLFVPKRPWVGSLIGGGVFVLVNKCGPDVVPGVACPLLSSVFQWCAKECLCQDPEKIKQTFSKETEGLCEGRVKSRGN